MRTNGSKQFDVHALDAFSGDAVPVHLLTREAFAMYERHMKPDGVIAVNISNRHIDLSPVLRATAAERGMGALLVAANEDGAAGITHSVWVLLSKNREFLENPKVTSLVSPWPDNGRPPMIWTDDFSTIYDLLH